MPLLAEPALRAPITVAKFEAAFARKHPSITYGTSSVEGLVLPGPMPINVRTMTGKTITLRVQPDATVKQVVLMIYPREGIPWEQQRVVFAGRQLENKRTLSECGIGRETIIDLVLRMPGD